jgi:uncharacterized protein
MCASRVQEGFVVGRYLYLFAGHLSLALAFIGIFIPLLPTVPFVLLAAFCYSRGSDRFHRWLLAHPRFGPAVAEWRDHRIVRPRAKALSVVTLSLSLCFPLFILDLSIPVRVIAGLIIAGVMVFLLSCPSAEGPVLTVDDLNEEAKNSRDSVKNSSIANEP